MENIDNDLIDRDIYEIINYSFNSIVQQDNQNNQTTHNIQKNIEFNDPPIELLINTDFYWELMI